ncbi:MAG: DUF4397 domain-containing protein [Anaerolineae bacterium]|nr:DUF4397 domain-containing protein [Anaerolineae bacterium]
MQPASASARLRFMNLSPGEPPLDVYIDDTLIVASLGYGHLSEYLESAPGRHRVRCYPAGTGGWEDLALDADLEKLRPRFDYTLALVNRLQDLRPVLLEDTEEAPGREQAKVRFLHASPDAPALDVSTGGGRVLFTLVPFARATPFKRIESGTYDIEIRRSGHGALIAALREYALAGERFYTFVALGLVDGEPPFALMPLVAPASGCAPVP